MLKTVTLFHAAPYVLGLALLLSGGAAWLGYSKGYAASEQLHEAAGVKDLVRAVQRVAKVGEAIAEIGRQLRDQLADSRANETQATRAVRTANAAHPDFAALRRPDAYQRVRDDQLDRIRRAAEAD